MPLIIISYFELIIMIIIGIGCMVLPVISNWLGIILCYTIMVVSVLIFVSAKVIGENTSKANTNLNTKVFQMREITNQASELISMAKDDETKTLMQKIFDAIRYSDPISTEETYSEEIEMIKLLAEIKVMIESSKCEEIKNKSDELIRLIDKRNNKCISLKRQRI